MFNGCDKKGEEVVLCYYDANYATNLDNRKSQTGYLFIMFGTMVSWKSDLQGVVFLSTIEAAYMALTTAVCKKAFGFRVLRQILVMIRRPWLSIVTVAQLCA